MASPRSRVRFSVGANFRPGLKKFSCCASPALRLPIHHPLAWGHCRVGSGRRPVSDGRPGFGDFFDLRE
jgi:hypothetical protein